MNIIEKLKGLKNNECLYTVKQYHDFDKLCYALDIIFNKGNTAGFNYGTEIVALNSNLPKGYSVSNNIKAIGVTYYYGLSDKNGAFKKATKTLVFDEIEKRCSKLYFETSKYQDIIDSQIEKIYLNSWKFDDEVAKRSQYKVHPTLLLLKVLISIGDITKSYKITKQEFKLFVATIEKYSDYSNAVINIIAFRSNFKLYPENHLKNITNDLRVQNAFTQLSYIKSNNGNDIEIDITATLNPIYNKENLNVVKDKINNYEQKEFFKQETEDINFLQSLDTFETLSSYKDLSSINQFSTFPATDIKKNRIVYGAPGTGKSKKISDDIGGYNSSQIERTTFYADYTFGKFVGMFKPVSGGDYKYQGGPFLRVLVKALKDSEHPYFLIIDEINRTDAAATFGDIFQLLDRDKTGKSEYSIDISEDMKTYFEEESIELEDGKLYIPSNLYIWSTMNSADQGVFPLDSAFKRRWSMEYIDIDAGSDSRSLDNIDFDFSETGVKHISWKEFRTKLNDVLTKEGIREDKQIATYFLSDEELNQEDFVNKLLMYLSEDVVRHNKSKVFDKDLRTYGRILKKFKKDGKIFSESELNDLFE